MQIVLIETYFMEKDWRTPAAYKLIFEALSENWEVVSVMPESKDDLIEEIRILASQGPIFIVNVAEYLDENLRKYFIPEILDELGFPFLGSGAGPALLERHKAETKEVLISHGIPTPDYLVAKNPEDIDVEKAESITYPLFAKPEFSGGHFGIDENSICNNLEELKVKVNEILETYHQDTLVEKYIDGPSMREFTTGVIDTPERIFTPREINFDQMGVDVPILTTNMPKDISPVEHGDLRDLICELSGRTHDAINALDYSRVDLRMDDTGIYVLEIQTMPGHGTSVPMGAELLGISYADKLHLIVTVSMERQGLLPEGSAASLQQSLGVGS